MFPDALGIQQRRGPVSRAVAFAEFYWNVFQYDAFDAD